MATAERDKPSVRAKVYWVHPSIGEIVEVACIQHRRDILTAMRVLGQAPMTHYLPEDADVQCWRCETDADKRGVAHLQARLRELVLIEEAEAILRGEAS